MITGVFIKEEAKIVPGAWEEIKRRHEKNLAEDRQYRRAYERTKENGVKKRAAAFAKGGKALEDAFEEFYKALEVEKAGKSAIDVNAQRTPFKRLCLTHESAADLSRPKSRSA